MTFYEGDSDADGELEDLGESIDDSLGESEAEDYGSDDWELEELLEELDAEELIPEEEEGEDWHDLIEEVTEEATDISEYVLDSPHPGAEFASHFDFLEDAIHYAEDAPFGILWVVAAEDGGWDVVRDQYE